MGVCPACMPVQHMNAKMVELGIELGSAGRVASVLKHNLLSSPIIT